MHPASLEEDCSVRRRGEVLTQESVMFDPNDYPELFRSPGRDRVRDLENQRVLEELRWARRRARRARVRQLLTGHGII